MATSWPPMPVVIGMTKAETAATASGPTALRPSRRQKSNPAVTAAWTEKRA